MIEIRQDIMQVSAEFTGDEFVVNIVIGSNCMADAPANDSVYGRRNGAWVEIDVEAYQADWNQSDTESPEYIKNKPTIPPDLWEADGDESIKPVPLEDETPVTVGIENIRPPAAATATTPDNTDTLPIYKQATEETPAGWFKFTWAKLKEWLGTYFSPFRIAAPVISFAPVALNDTLQDIAGKVLGVQDYLIDYTTPVNASSIDITHDRYGDPINIPIGRGLVILIDAPNFKTTEGVDATSRVDIRINGEAGSRYFTLNLTTNRFIVAGTNYLSQRTVINMFNFGTVYYFSHNNQPSSNAGQMYNGWTLFQITNITSITLVPNGNLIGAGTRIILKPI